MQFLYFVYAEIRMECNPPATSTVYFSSFVERSFRVRCWSSDVEWDVRSRLCHRRSCTELAAAGPKHPLGIGSSVFPSVGDPRRRRRRPYCWGALQTSARSLLDEALWRSVVAVRTIRLQRRALHILDGASSFGLGTVSRSTEEGFSSEA